MKKIDFSFPFHPFLLAIYPALALYSHNASEVAGNILIRPVIFSLVLASILLILGKLVFRSWSKSALAASVIIILFFSYGHLYNYLKASPELVTFARHRYLVFSCLAVLAAALFFIARQKGSGKQVSTILNLTTAFLIAFPLVQSATNAVAASRASAASYNTPLSVQPLTPPKGDLPSVYLIVLDGYMRSDALQRDLGFDNSTFVNQLEERGFYVPSCSRPNYDFTMASLTATLNMDYSDVLLKELEDKKSDIGLFGLIKKSRVRAALEALGYRSAALDSGFEWSRIYDADMYLSFYSDPLAIKALRPFEFMLVKSTALRLLTDFLIQSTRASFVLPVSQFSEHLSITRFSLQTLPALASEKDPLFVFAHILIPHWPYIYLPDGSIRDDPVYTTDELTWDQRRQGYTDSIQYINGQMLSVVDEIMETSEVPPVILIMGDHGLTKENRVQNFTAFYMPGENQEGLYPHISTVNYFRVIFNEIFGADYPLLPDLTYLTDETTPYPETAPECIQ